MVYLSYGNHEFLLESDLSANHLQIFNANVSSGGEFEIEELNVINGSSLSLQGLNPQISTVNLSNSSLDISPSQANSVAVIGTLNLPAGATLSGQAVIQINDVFNWTGGTIGTSSSETDLSFSGEILCSGGTVRNATITNSGDLTWSSGQVAFLEMTVGLLMRLEQPSRSPSMGHLGVSMDTVSNSAMTACCTRRADSGITYMYLRLYNRGVVQIDRGQIFLGCGYVSNSPSNPPSDAISYLRIIRPNTE